ncbi:MAG: hypothetical protein Q8N61_01720, partial [bacterium]|nr:hypothetical protein [bacterium]
SQGYLNNAIDILNKALASGHRNASVLVLLGIANGELGFDNKAFYYFNEALRLDAKSEEAMLNMGIFYANHNQLNKAIEIWQEGLNKNPNSTIIKENIDRAKELLWKRR